MTRSNKPSVAIIGTRGYPSYYGGFETLVRRLAPYLAGQGWDVTVYSRHGQIIESQASPEVDVRYTPGIDSKSLSTLSYGATASLTAAVQKPDVALVMNVANGFFLPALKARGIPVVLNVDGLEWERDKWSAAARRVFKTGAHMSARCADTLVSDSTNIAAYWRREFNRESVFIPYGGYFDEATVDSKPASELEGLETGNFVLAVARMVPENSIDTFLEAAALLDDSIHVVLAGSAASGDPLQAKANYLARSRKNVHLLGHIKNDQFLNWLWSNCGAYFHGHTVGGTNPALVQAMACGAPVVARDTVFSEEVLDGTGMLVSGDPSTVSAAIEQLILSPDLRAKYRAAAQRRAATYYGWDSVLETYRRTLDGARVGRS